MSFVLLGILNSQAAGGAAGATTYDLLETFTVGTAVDSVSWDLSAYEGTYDNFQLHISFRSTRTAGNDIAKFLYNGSNLTSRHQYDSHSVTGASFESWFASNGSDMYYLPDDSSTANAWASIIMDIYDIFDTNKICTLRGNYGCNSTATSSYQVIGQWAGNTGIASYQDISFGHSPYGDIKIGTKFALYGLGKAA